MSNMPIITASAPAAPKAAAPAAQSNEDTPSQPFGQVLASQMSGKQGKPAGEAKKGEATTDAKADASQSTAASSDAALIAKDPQAILAQDPQAVTPADAVLGLLPAQQVLAAQAIDTVGKSTSAATKVDADITDKTSKRGKDLTDLGKSTGRPTRPEIKAETQGENIKKSDSTALTDAVLDAAKGGSPRQNGIANFQEALSQSQSAIQSSSASGLHAMQANNTANEVRPAATTVSTPVAQPGWHDDFSQKVTWVATQNLQSADIHLNPPQLGPVSVSLDIKGDQAIAHFVSAHPAVREAIEQALPKLRQMMEDSGITLSDASVGSQARRENSDTPQRKQQDSLPNVGSISDNIQSGAPKGMRITGQPRHNGMLDTFA